MEEVASVEDCKSNSKGMWSKRINMNVSFEDKDVIYMQKLHKI